MSKIYEQKKRPTIPVDEQAANAVAQHTPSMVSGDSRADLGQLMLGKFQQHFLDNQISSAEQEADRIASSVSSARTPDEVKRQLGEKMGADFSGVTFHTDASAVNTADVMGARAYTSGSDVYFGSGGFDPGVAAHELVHTVQQGVVGSSMQTTSAPMGSVQMKPGLFRRIANSEKVMGIRAKLTGIKEFLSGGNKATPEEKAANLEKAKNGDYSRLVRTNQEQVQTELIQPKMAQIANKLINGATVESLLETYGSSTTDMLNPITRNAMSQLLRSGMLPKDKAKVLENAMESMDSAMIINTMQKPGEAQRNAVISHYKNDDDQKRAVAEYDMSKKGKTRLGKKAGMTFAQAEREREAAYNAVRLKHGRSQPQAEKMADKAIKRNQNATDSMLRLMFLMQMGSFYQTDGEGDQEVNKMWEHTMANAMSHGSRVGYIFNQSRNGADMDSISNAIFGDQMGKAAGVYARAAATHHIDTPTEDGGGYLEKHGPKAALSAKKDKTYHHYGMDLAIGGIGNGGIAGAGGQGQMINADGRSGHMYIGRKDSTEKQAGGLLLGLGTDSPYRMNQMGHMHNAAATPEAESNTGGLRADLKGNKYNGRTVNLERFENEEVVELLDKFSSHFRNLRDNEDQTAYNALVEQISGKRISEADMPAFIKSFMGEDISDEKMQKIVRAGGRQYNRIDKFKGKSPAEKVKELQDTIFYINDASNQQSVTQEDHERMMNMSGEVDDAFMDELLNQQIQQAMTLEGMRKQYLADGMSEDEVSLRMIHSVESKRYGVIPQMINMIGYGGLSGMQQFTEEGLRKMADVGDMIDRYTAKYAAKSAENPELAEITGRHMNMFAQSDEILAKSDLMHSSKAEDVSKKVGILMDADKQKEDYFRRFIRDRSNAIFDPKRKY